MKKREVYRTHASYGMVEFCRVTGHIGRLFGSSIRNHHASIRLRIHQADVKFDLSREWYQPGTELLEVELSAVQFAELLTSLNHGSGVPCTIRFLSGVGFVEDPPDDETEVERVRHGFAEYTKTVSQRYTEFTDIVAKLLKGSKASLKVKGEVEMAIKLLHQAITADMPFAADQFQRATDKVVAAAKAEVDAFITNVIAKTGLRVLKDQFVAQAMIEGRVEEEDD